MGSIGPLRRFIPVVRVGGVGCVHGQTGALATNHVGRGWLGASRGLSFGGAVGVMPVLSPFLSPPPAVSSRLF